MSHSIVTTSDSNILPNSHADERRAYADFASQQEDKSEQNNGRPVIVEISVEKAEEQCVATHDPSLSDQQRCQLDLLAGIFAGRDVHLCPHCFSLIA